MFYLPCVTMLEIYLDRISSLNTDTAERAKDWSLKTMRITLRTTSDFSTTLIPAAKQKLTHLDSQLSGNIDEHSDPFPGDAVFKHFVCHLLKFVPLGLWASSHPVNCTETEISGWMGNVKVQKPLVSFQYCISKSAIRQVRNSLLERPVFVHPVANYSNHHGQLDHHLLLLSILYFHQGRERWDILRG